MSPLIRPHRRCFWANGRWGDFASTWASGHTGVSAWGHARDFGLHGGDSCGDSADLGYCLFFKLVLKSTSVAPRTHISHRLYLVRLARGAPRTLGTNQTSTKGPTQLRHSWPGHANGVFKASNRRCVSVSTGAWATLVSMRGFTHNFGLHRGDSVDLGRQLIF